jgi:hypothetical protein
MTKKKPTPITTATITRYVLWIPEQPRPGWALAHNHVRHNKNTPPGERGFRAWWFSPPNEPPENFILCPCGWAAGAGEHYAHKKHVMVLRKKRKTKKTAAR